MADIKYIFTDLGDLSGSAGKIIRVNSVEKQLEFINLNRGEYKIKKEE